MNKDYTETENRIRGLVNRCKGYLETCPECGGYEVCEDCEDNDGKIWIHPDLNLESVLEALELDEANERLGARADIAIIQDGTFFHCESGEWEELGNWQYGKPFSEQSEECKDFITNLLDVR